MKCVRFILFFVALIAILIVAGAMVVTMSGGLDNAPFHFGNGMQSYRDRSSGVFFVYPASWEREYLGVEMVRFRNEKRVFVFSTKEREADSTRTLDEYTRENLREIAESAEHDGFTIVVEESGPYEVGGHAGHRIATLMEKDEQIVRGLQYWTIVRNRVITLTFSTPLNEFENAVQEFEDVVKSIKIRL